MNTGVYLLFVELSKKKTVEIGSLGKHVFEPGIYYYVGSGMNGLDQRVERHRGSDKKKHWHIDYLLEHGSVVGALKLRTDRDLECRLNEFVSAFSKETPVHGFGSSDCECRSHLHRVV